MTLKMSQGKSSPGEPFFNAEIKTGTVTTIQMAERIITAIKILNSVTPVVNSAKL
jgi:hypothetical protein